MTDQDSIIDRIQKILAKIGRGATEEEAKTAMAFAAKLLADHNLSMADVSNLRPEWNESEIWKGARPQPESKHIGTILNTHFFVRPIFARGPNGCHLFLFGDRASVEVGAWLYGRLIDQYRDLWSAFRLGRRVIDPRTGNPVKPSQVSYYRGLTAGLNLRLFNDRKSSASGDDQAESHAVALIDVERKIDLALMERHPGIKEPRPVMRAPGSPDDFVSGLNDSNKLSVARPIGGNATKALPAPGKAASKQKELF